MDEVEHDSDDLWRDVGIAQALYGLKRMPEADDALARFTDKYEHDGAYQIASIHSYRGEVDEAFHWLDKAYEAGDPGLSQIIGDQFFENLFDDPRWAAFLEKLGLPTAV